MGRKGRKGRMDAAWTQGMHGTQGPQRPQRPQGGASSITYCRVGQLLGKLSADHWRLPDCKWV
ncbi:hypothetical protein DUZ99_13965 [Xylanibacillus composti]|uniref:Uncharacterized protein n=1 Tax=Xylanibacillus composti TaxID=1572762 RepID=A0A8J4H4K0_9BACL|nr:hypothetical protein [Xylanibacillus composti]MDT9726084.1 hypothetical protein [Xylanibacillus composti]GIQ68769.1 hypothetical protein XYCOK13_15930 [Xylanibacillus composti]